ncbi:response regulator [Vibrio sp. S4M6]|uniref:response regulator n=1 Tax=Vibrio sinus TaxID=2946865 RepID=UPI00202A8E24|nr:response regulator [Vibrio sinus]MCL9783742.1 response regulator [Vibrio sinus]
MDGPTVTKNTINLDRIITDLIPTKSSVKSDTTLDETNRFISEKWEESTLLDEQNSDSALLPFHFDIQPWSLKFLVVDDLKTNRLLLGSLLYRLGHSCDFAENGKEAIHKGKRSVYDAVFLDLRMPGMSGWDTYCEWRKVSNRVLDPDCMVIAVSADAGKARHDKAIEFGMSGYLAKPVSLINLDKTVKNIIAHQVKRNIDLLPKRTVQRSILKKEDIRQELGSTIDTLVKVSKTGNLDELGKVNHSLKGITGSAGIQALHKITIELERCIHAGRSVNDRIKKIVEMNDMNLW